ncbi:hypothetical protein ILUMI_23906 [Ignelater luminosus]|uniref:NACHT domain-containing protein n=1 Tax=Ignelater luminosus TaxID=2038154 RepID=A0A8K0CDN6_IGNLU|nr:hypothetical protein ILUMI_23906 [Ignelater luminosus]
MAVSSDEFRIPKDFSASPGTVDFGKDYEVKIPALLGMRCIRNKEINGMWLATNVDKCGAVDDLVLHIETQKKKKITYLIQLKHKEKPDDIKAGEFKKAKKDDFSMQKYYETVVEIKTAIDTKKETDTEVVNHLRENQDSLIFVLYTNRGTTKNDFLNKVNRNSEIDNTWLLYKMIDTNGSVSMFDYDKLGFKYNNDHKSLMDKLFLYTKQIHVNKLDGAIEDEVNGFLKQLVLPKQTTKQLVQQYLQFVTDWHKGKLGGFYPLAKSDIYKVLLSNIFTPYVEVIHSVKENTFCYDLWEEIIKDKWVTVVEEDDLVAEFITSYISKAVEGYCENSDNKNLWKRHSESLGKQILRTTNKSKDVKPAEAYELLWKTRKIPLLLNTSSSDERDGLIKLIKLFPNIFSVIILTKQSKEFINSENLFICLKDLDSRHVSEILIYPVKLQGRKSVKLLQYLKNDNLHYISVRDIIYILNNKFSIGDEISTLPEVFIKRTLETVWLEPKVLEVKDQLFIIQCNLKSNLRIFFTRHKLKINDSQVLQWNDDIEFKKCDIIQVKNKGGMDKIIKYNLLKDKPYHYLILHNGNYLQWIKSSGPIKNIINFRKVSNLSNFEVNCKNTLFTNCLNGITLISACPGMGKSSLLDYIASNTYADTWVIKINLYQHIDYYRCDNFTKVDSLQHLKYLFNNNVNEDSNNDLVRLIFEQHLNDKKVILLLDGFDEIPIPHHDKVIEMIKTISKAMHSIFVTTRPNLKFYLEEGLDIFGININSFTNANQTEFLTQFFSNACGVIFLESITTFVEKLLRSSKQNLNDHDQKFTEIPLQTQLLAEVFTEDCRNFIETNEFKNTYFDLIYLYENFINKKIKIVCDKFGNSSEDSVHHYKTLRSLYALQLLFPSDDIKELNFEGRIKQVMELFPNTLHQIQKDGIVFAETAEKITFVHRTFAEYLAAQWLANNLNGENQDIAKKLIIKTFNPSLVTVRNIFDRILAKDCPLHFAIINRQVETAKKLISDPIMLSETDKYNRNCLHLIACWGVYHPFNIKPTRELQVLYQMIAEDPVKQILDFIPDKELQPTKDNLLGYTEVDYAIQSGSLNIADAICERLKNIDECLTLKDINLNYVLYLKSFSYGSLGSVLLKHSVTTELAGIIKERQSDNNEEYELHHHIVKGNIQQASLLLCLEERINKADHRGFTPLHIAVIFGDALITQLLFANNVNVNARDASGKTSLHWAVIKGEVNMITMLLDNNIEVDAVDNNGMSALHYAVVANINNRNEIVFILLKNDANITIQDNYKKTVLHYALHYNEIDILKLLIEFGLNISVETEYPNTDSLLNVLSSQDSDGGTVLHWAADKGFVDLATLFLSYGANTEIQDEDGKTAMHWAAEKGHTDLVILLLSHKAYIDAMDKLGRTPLYLAVHNGNIDTAELLLNHGASLHTTDRVTGRTPLLQAIVQNNITLINLLLNYKAVLAQKDNEDANALHLAAFTGNTEIAKLLLSMGVQLENKHSSGVTALMTAALNGQISIVRLLLSNGANIEARDNEGLTSLHYASFNGHLETVELLLSHGANLEAKDECNRTPLICAALNGNAEIIQLLLLKGANVEATDDHGKTALNCAACNNQENGVNVLIVKGHANLDTVDIYGATALLNAVKNGYADITASLLCNGASLKAKDNHGINALHYAAFQGFVNIVDLLLANGAEIDSRSNGGKTALIGSADAGHLPVLTFLWSKGADIEAKDNENMTALSWAALSGHAMLVNLLIGLKANFEVKNTNGRTPLICAAENGHMAVVQLLVSKGANIDVIDIDGVGPVQWAAYGGFTEMVTFFLSKGVCVDVKDREGRTLLMHAAFNNHINVINLLLCRGANINEQDDIGLTTMHAAARNGHVETIKLLISKGADKELKDFDGQTPVMRAAYFNQQSVVELLIENGANIDIRDKNCDTILHYCGLHGNTDLIEMVLDIKADLINLKDWVGKTALIHAATSGHAPALTLLISKGAEVNSSDNENNTALIWAAHNGHGESVDVLITLEANVEMRNNYGRTPLLCAAEKGHIEIAKQLIAKGANTEVVDSEGFTAVQLAAYNGHLEILLLFLSQGVSVNEKNSGGKTLLMLAALNNHLNILDLILDKGTNINEQDNVGQTALHCAAEKGNTEAVSLLLSRGADMEIKDSQGQTVLFCAFNYNQDPIIKLLIEKGANVEATDNSEWTVLHLAAVHNNTNAIEIILNINSNMLNLKNNSGKTALMMAAIRGQTAAVELLLSKGADIDMIDKEGKTALHFAALRKHAEIIKILVNNEADLAIQDDQGCTAFEVITYLFSKNDGSTSS